MDVICTKCKAVPATMVIGALLEVDHLCDSCALKGIRFMQQLQAVKGYESVVVITNEQTRLALISLLKKAVGHEKAN